MRRDSVPTRPTLLLRIRDRADADAWSEFVELYTPLLFRYARKRGLQGADAADFAQEVLLTVSNRIDRFDYDPLRGTFRAWLFRVARSRLTDLLRRAGREPAGTGTTGAHRLLAAQADETEEHRHWDEEYQRCVFEWAVRHERPRVAEKTWQAFWRTAVQNEPVERVARDLKMTPGAVYVARSRVVARLRERVERIGDGEPSSLFPPPEGGGEAAAD